MGESNSSAMLQRKEDILNRCKLVIGGVWKDVDLHHFNIETVSGGLSNYLYLCKLPQGLKSKDNEPDKVLIRIYGDAAATGDELLQETVVVSLLGEKMLAPKVYGFFQGGRFEQFLQGRTLQTSQLQLRNVSDKIATCFANLHQTVMPLTKEPNWILDSIDRMFEPAITLTFNDKNKQAVYQKLLSFNLPAMRDEIRQILQSCESEICFCHNDLQENNVIVCGDPASADAKFHFIDFEYSGYNYSAFDLGNYFCEWTLDYIIDKPPHFKYCWDDYPSEEDQIYFLASYLKKRHELKNLLTDEGAFASELRKLQLEVNRLALASHFVWALWSCIQARTSEIEFDYLEYALARLKGYNNQKEFINRI